MTLVLGRYTGKVRGHSLEEEKDELARMFDDVCGKGPTNIIGWWGSGLVNTCGWRASDCCTGVAPIGHTRDSLVQIEKI